MPFQSTWPLELKDYFISISNTYNLRISLFFREITYTCFDTILLSTSNIITFLSMGKESLYSLSITIKNKLFKNIIVVFVNNANYGTNYREHQQFLKFSHWFSTSNIDSRVKFHQVEYEVNLLGLQNNEHIIKIDKQQLKEPIVKVQYMELLLSPLIRFYKCGVFIVPMDYQEKNFNCNSYFGDQPISFISFNKFFCKYVGGHVRLRFQGLEVTREDKTLTLINLGWFKYVSSCYMNWNYFDFYRNSNNINPVLNMCGSCWKCQLDINMFRKSKSLNKLIKLTNK